MGADGVGDTASGGAMSGGAMSGGAAGGAAGRSDADVDLTALGLPSLPARVLACVADEGWTTALALAGRLDVGPPEISRAVSVLVERGLVERTLGQRPAPVRLARQLTQTVDATLEQLQGRRRAEQQRAEAAAAHLRRAAALCESRPGPMACLDPRGPAGLALPRSSYDEVCRADGPTMLWAAPLVSRLVVPRRILVLGDPPADRVRLMRRKRIACRSTDAALPVLLIVDRVRARIEVTYEGRAAATGWTCDAAQVGAALRLFELWWEESTAC